LVYTVVYSKSMRKETAMAKESKGEKALGLLKMVMPFLDCGSECLVCGGEPNYGHERGCFVAEIESLTGYRIWDGGEVKAPPRKVSR
jgi:hypothetical protein